MYSEKLTTAVNLIPREELLTDLALDTPKRFGTLEDANQFRILYLSCVRAFGARLRVQFPRVEPFGKHAKRNSTLWSLHIDTAQRSRVQVPRGVFAEATLQELSRLYDLNNYTIASIYRSEKKILRLQQQIAADMMNPEIIPPVVEKFGRVDGKEQRVVTLD